MSNITRRAGAKYSRGGEKPPSRKARSDTIWGLMSAWVGRLQDPDDISASCLVAGLLLLAEVALCIVITLKVPYTKIDWDAYMSQVSGFLSGERDYTKLEGDTGPLVYPAGFLYAFAGLQYLTGGEVGLAQWYFVALYLVNQALVLVIYIRTKVVPPWALVLLCLSKRVHSVFLLRLFNDCLATTVFHVSLIILQGGTWNVGLSIFSAAVAIKMNVLLFAPPLQLLLLKGTTMLGVAAALSCAATLQVLLGLPFLLHHPMEYISRSFNLGRVFTHFWSVNFKFVPEPVFISKPFALSLLAVHLSLLALFAHFKWCKHEGGISAVIRWPLGNSAATTAGHDSPLAAERRRPACIKTKQMTVTAEHITTVMFMGNFIGIVCARSLHYQFYTWYFYSLPYLLWLTPFSTLTRIILWALIELCWNIYPSTAASSLLLLVCHIALLGGLWVSRQHYLYLDDSKTAEKKFP